jgi:hypothetical protein
MELGGRASPLRSGPASGLWSLVAPATLVSKKFKKAGSLTFTVKSVSLSGYTYAPSQNVKTSETITAAASETGE